MNKVKVYKNQRKKKRDPNVNCDEKNLLVDLVTKYFKIIENKKTDGETLTKKNEAWELLSKEYNESTSHIQRSESVLRNCWKNMKEHAKKLAAREINERIKTGGSTAKENVKDSILQRVVELIMPSIVGSANRHQQKNGDDDDFGDRKFEEAENIEKEEEESTHLDSSQLRTPRIRISKDIYDSTNQIINSEKYDFDEEDPLDDQCCRIVVFPEIPASSVEPNFKSSPNKSSMTTFSVIPNEKSMSKRSASPIISAKQKLSYRRHSISVQTKNDELFSTKIFSLAAAEEEHKVVMEIHNERLKQEKIKTNILMMEWEALKRKKNEKSNETVS